MTTILGTSTFQVGEITSTLTPNGDRNITIWNEDGSITALLVTKDLKAYRLYRHEDGENLQAVELEASGNTHRTSQSGRS